jgi:PLP dependent protein
MPFSYEIFAERAQATLERIAGACLACGRDAAEVRLLPVTKTHPAQAAAFAARFGFPSVGENRVQEAISKQDELGPGAVKWELIGHLQSNKAKLAAARFDRIQSVDSLKLIDVLGRCAAEAGRVLPILLQINAGRDPAKFGAELEEAPALLERALSSPALRVEGLMTIAPLSDDEAVARRTFDSLRTCRDELQGRFGVALPELSMGMSGDLEAAVRSGSTLVRVGSALFGERSPTG